MGNSNGDNKKNFPNLAGFLPPTITSNPQLYSDPGEESKNEEDLKKREETNKLRDKLAAKAREKMVQVAKEKALQLERKKKAAQFLAQLADKKTTVSSNEAVENDEKHSSAEEGEIESAAAGDGVADSNVSVVDWVEKLPSVLIFATFSTFTQDYAMLSLLRTIGNLLLRT